MFVVEGGEFTGTDFQNVIPGTEEFHGPFDTYEEALETWSGRARANLDTCCHRVTIRHVP
jgi:hypothetical protein